MRDQAFATWAEKGSVKLVSDPKHGFLRVDPLPSETEIAEFYQQRYFAVLERTGRAPDIARLMGDDENARKEREWLSATAYADAADLIQAHAPGKRTIDVGCGSGGLVDYLVHRGFDAAGFDPSIDAVEYGKARNLNISRSSVSEFIQKHAGKQEYDAITMIGVIECLREPDVALDGLRQCLKPGGILFLRAGNQFNSLQIAASNSVTNNAWWITVPDHLNYFDRDSLLSLLKNIGFTVLDVFSDFPMEMFILMGDNYVGDSAVGAACHARRVAFENNLSKSARRELYRGFAREGIGRSIYVAAKALA